MTGAFEGSTRSKPDGRFEIGEKEHLRFFISIGDDGCDYTVRASGYCEWRELSLCGKVHIDWNLYDVRLFPDQAACAPARRMGKGLVCTPDSDHN